jgi:hypothetical protein
VNASAVPLGRRARRIALGVAASIAVLAGAWAAFEAIDARRQAAQGARAFDGRSPLVGRIEGHAAPLPAAALACANCHLPSARPAGALDPAGARSLAPAPAAPGGAGATGQAASFGPVLDRAGLTARVARRGGPPSRFDERAFCRLLRTGEDPAGVLLPRAMPRYDIDDDDCRRLWRHVTRASA